MRDLDDTKLLAGSIAVAQSRPKGKVPQAVRILRCVWRTTKGDDGRTFGRSDDTEVFRLASGTTALSERDVEALRELGLTEVQLEYVNGRLPTLARLAAEHRDEVISIRARRSISEVEALARSNPLMCATVQTLLTQSASRIADLGAVPMTATDLQPSASSTQANAGDRLLAAMQQLNGAAVEVQTAYRQLAKGEEPPPAAAIEFQRSWFLVQAMVEALRSRDCFYRPGGWSGLKHQVIVEGRAWRKGEPVPKKERAGA
ncbi:hypothetical protein [Rhizobacter sp. SG703]|uniref:hypothetical protein n=1 Tax=Rhizobacter sp. SG703 TaxID=2587140 RepID=UPI001447852A|nr:hypothetical protein [Rhizobacter sp. SG703]NKI93506.1 hypothetical protein [Rhizobacter sp. SG703]